MCDANQLKTYQKTYIAYTIFQRSRGSPDFANFHFYFVYAFLERLQFLLAKNFAIFGKIIHDKANAGLHRSYLSNRR